MVRKYDFVGSRPIQLICTGSEAHNHIAFSLTIKGEAAQKTVIVDNRGLNLPTFFIESEGNLILDGLTITRGTTGPPSRGGIINRGTLNVKNSKIENSRADQGVGAGILNLNEGTLNIENSSITGNTAIDRDVATLGGGILNGGTAVIVNSTISNNTVLNGVGGGIANRGAITIVNSSILANRTEGRTSKGGAISNSGSLVLLNSTIADNTAATGNIGFPGGPVQGGGIWNEGTAELQNTILADNTIDQSARMQQAGLQRHSYFSGS